LEANHRFGNNSIRSLEIQDSIKMLKKLVMSFIAFDILENIILLALFGIPITIQSFLVTLLVAYLFALFTKNLIEQG